MAAELKVMSARAVNAAVTILGQRFMRASGRMVVFEFAPVGALESRLAAGEAADVIILSDSAIETMDKAGQLVAGSRTVLGRTSIGVGVREGVPAPDISTPEAFRATLLAVRSIAVSDPAVGGTAARYLPQLFARMGIAGDLEPKLLRCRSGGDAAERVAHGEADIGITFISEFLPIPGTKVVGPLPAVYGNDTTYCAAVPAGGDGGEAALALIQALTGPATRDVWKAAGFESGG